MSTSTARSSGSSGIHKSCRGFRSQSLSLSLSFSRSSGSSGSVSVMIPLLLVVVLLSLLSCGVCADIDVSHYDDSHSITGSSSGSNMDANANGADIDTHTHRQHDYYYDYDYDVTNHDNKDKNKDKNKMKVKRQLRARHPSYPYPNPNPYNDKDVKPYLEKLRLKSQQQQSMNQQKFNQNRSLQKEQPVPVNKEPVNNNVNKEPVPVNKEPVNKDLTIINPKFNPVPAVGDNVNGNGNGNGNGADKNNKDNDKVPATPSPSISFPPTISPTKFPTRAPVVVPWIQATQGSALLKVSLFTYHIQSSVNRIRNRNRNRYRNRNRLLNGKNDETAGHIPNQNQNQNLQRKLNNIPMKAGDILSGSNPNLISNVTSAMAAIVCTSTQVHIGVLSVRYGRFFDYCRMLSDDNDHDNDADASNNAIDAGIDADADTGMEQYEIVPQVLSSMHTYIVTDFYDDATGLLNIDDRSVFIPNLHQDQDQGNTNRNQGIGQGMGGYFHWTAWSIEYPVLQFGSLEYLNPNPDWEMVDLNDNGNGNGTTGTEMNAVEAPVTVYATMEDLQMNLDRIFASAVANGEMDTFLKEQSAGTIDTTGSDGGTTTGTVTDAYRYVTSMEGFEVDTFTTAINEFDQEFNQNPDGDGGDGDDSNNTNPALEIQRSDDGKATFFKPIRIAGIIMLLSIISIVAILTKVGHERYNYDVWDATGKGPAGNNITEEDQGVEVDLVTYEGLDFMLQHGHQMRKHGGVGVVQRKKRGGKRSRMDMDMGNTKSEIAGHHVGTPQRGSATGRAGSGGRESPVVTSQRGVKNTLYAKLGWDNKEDYDAEVAADRSLMPVDVTTDAQVAGRRNDKKQESLMDDVFPLQAPDSPTAEDLLRDVDGGGDDAPTTPLPKKGRKKRLLGGRKRELRVPSPPPSPPPTPKNNEERIGSGDEYVFISVTSKI